MTTETITRVLCDAEHDDEEHEAALTVELALGTRRVLIDLCRVHSGRLEALLEPWLAAGAPIPKARASRPTATPRRRPVEEARVIRAWALEHGLRISERGRIPEEVVRLWNEAQG